ncbi:MAG TPA: class E sortase [Ilumatobacteraceae bacterium]|nr:class E sortase [Ilumatobacteraceae bacterium]
MAANGGKRRRASIRTATGVLASLTALTSVALAGCGGSDDASADAASPTVAATAPPTTEEATTTSAAKRSTTSSGTSTSTSTTSSTSPSTSTSTTTVAAEALVLPQPISPPLDEYGVEPVIEVGWIEIPAIDVYMAMYEGIRLTTLDYGPGHWPGSAMPGHIGNTVIAGHRTSKHKVFRNLDQLEAGDEIIFDGVDGRHVYRVTSTEIIGPEAMWIVEQTPEFTATLFACHPPGSTRERIVVHAELAA